MEDVWKPFESELRLIFEIINRIQTDFTETLFELKNTFQEITDALSKIDEGVQEVNDKKVRGPVHRRRQKEGRIYIYNYAPSPKRNQPYQRRIY